jgi:hypothetical protein
MAADGVEVVRFAKKGQGTVLVSGSTAFNLCEPTVDALPLLPPHTPDRHNARCRRAGRSRVVNANLTKPT